MKIKSKNKSFFFTIFFSIFFIAISSCQEDDSIYDSPVTALVDSLNTQGKTPADSLIHQDSTVNPGNSSEAVNDTVSSPAASETVTPPVSNEPETNVPVETGSADANTDEPPTSTPEKTGENDNAETGATGSYVEAPVTTTPTTSTPSAPVQQGSGTTSNNPVPDISSDPFPSTTTPSTPSVVTSTEPAPAVSGHNIVNDLPKDYVKNGSVDYTSYIQAAVNKYNEIVFPGFPIMVNDKGIKIPSNRTITFLEGSKLMLKPTSKGSYNILRIDNVSNIVLNNPNILGDRSKHLGTTGEYGMGIGIYSSKNITLNNPIVSDCWGDGIYIGRSSGPTYSSNIQLLNAKISHCGRNGLAVISADGLKVDGGYFGYSTLCGIDVEGDHGDEELKNMTFTNVKTEHNDLIGFLIALSRTYDNRNKSLGVINIINHKDLASKDYAFKVSAVKPSTSGNISGTINVSNPVWSQSGSGRPNYYWVTDPQIKTYVTKPTVIDLSGVSLNGSALQTLLKRNIKYGFFNVSF